MENWIRNRNIDVLGAYKLELCRFSLAHVELQTNIHSDTEQFVTRLFQTVKDKTYIQKSADGNEQSESNSTSEPSNTQE